jgi:hypothetical protein
VTNPSPLADTPVEYGEDIAIYAASVLSPLSERDASAVMFLQSYHEALYLYGLEIPKIRVTGVK